MPSFNATNNRNKRQIEIHIEIRKSKHPRKGNKTTIYILKLNEARKYL